MRASLTLAALAFLALAGCSGPEVVPATKHAAVSPETVDIYATPPSKYEDLGTIYYTSPVSQKDQFNADPIIDDLKAKAAALGANGLLLTWPLPKGSNDVATNPIDSVLVGANYHGKWYHLILDLETHRKIQAKAIYMISK